jgi:Domain of unknown function (DUF4253)
MFDTIEAISNLLQGSFLEGREIRQLAIDESDQSAFLIQVDRAIALAAWELMRSHLEQTKRYPILTTGWGSDDFFARFYYQEEQSLGYLQSTSPAAILAEAASPDLAGFLESQKGRDAAYFEDAVASCLIETSERFGLAPDQSQIAALIQNGTIQSRFDIEKWLFDWELQHFSDQAGLAAPNTGYLDWFEPDGQTIPLLLLPIDNGWDALAYLHWYGACTIGTTVAINFLKQWHQQYGAELVCHYGTMLQLKVGRLPASPAAAFQLAWEQVAIAPCTIDLPGVSLRDHARALLSTEQWFLHERP